MAPSIQVFLHIQVVLLCCVVTTSMGGITDWEKAFSELENKVNVQQEEIKSLHQIIEQLEKRLEQLEAKGEFVEVLIQPAVPTLHVCWSGLYILLLTIEFMGLFHCMMSPVCEWQERILYNREW